ncbi:urease accessory protein UreF [Planosporangium flavigriseum]|uniref:Urease accessory protein UreF n=1 Tax=Planosporangium flavigriseum TaxID=373681 RepID=A0A8J3LN23_9ACTN|nr:urease accessory protein UreF [Planosporangium flavigriseum]NJC66901.1 urease accessory protein UreF [Planosporangium flavigriseum]GIG74354.1 urease accessory protein UreF [Planosporangium flavigriseum]
MIDFLRALQFGDSMFPVGAFSFSNGLEPAIQERVVRDPPTLAEFVRTATRQSATCDGVALIAAHRGIRCGDRGRAETADRALYARKPNEEMRAMTVRMGRKLADAAARISGSMNAAGPALDWWLREITEETTPGTYPVGLGLVFAELGVAEPYAFAVHQHGVALMMLSAALRLMPLHHLDGQAILYAVDEAVADDYRYASGLTLADMSAFAPQLDVLAATHVNAYVRMFMN